MRITYPLSDNQSNTIYSLRGAWKKDFLSDPCQILLVLLKELNSNLLEETLHLSDVTCMWLSFSMHPFSSMYSSKPWTTFEPGPLVLQP